MKTAAAGTSSRRRNDAPVAALDNSYAEAVADCRAIGGYWTGSSCRAPREEVVLTCPRGWHWSGLTGECQWVGRDGASCPPWQRRNGRCLTQADLTCRGGVVRLSGRGLSCQCPPGMAAWGRYPHLKCVPSLARVAPLICNNCSAAADRTRATGIRAYKQQAGGNRPGKGAGKGPGNRPGNGRGNGPKPNHRQQDAGHRRSDCAAASGEAGADLRPGKATRTQSTAFFADKTATR